MKNKLYYVLFLFYVMMAGFILYINGVFTKAPLSVSNLLINGVFLVVIGVIFVISAFGFSRLNRCTDDLRTVTQQLFAEYGKGGNKNLWGSYQDKKEVFVEPALKDAFDKYRARLKAGQVKRGAAGTCDIEDYINEELLDRVGLNYFNSGVSGTLTGLGILGTFLGLSWGLSSFNGNDIYAISDNVGPLLTGMKVAFHTSVYGIFFSLVFHFVYRSIMSDAYEKLDDFLTAFRQCAMPAVKTEDATQNTMLVYQANMANAMKQLLELAQGNAEKQQAGLEKIVDEFLAQMDAKLGAGMQKLGSALTDAGQSQVTYAAVGKQLAETMGQLLEENRIAQKQLLEMQKRQEDFAKELSAQHEKLFTTCDELSDDISNQLYTFEQMRSLYEK